MTTDRLRADELYIGVPAGNPRVEPDTRYDWPVLRCYTGEVVAIVNLTGRDAWLLNVQLENGRRYEAMV